MTTKENLYYQAEHSHEFYVKSYHLLKPLCVVLGVISLLSTTCLVLLLVFWQPQDRFFPVGPDGKVIPVQPLSTLNKSDAQIRAWSSEAVLNCYTMGPHDIERAIERCRNFFSDAGFEGFTTELQDPANQFVERILNNRQIMSAVPRSTPIITEKHKDQDGVAALWEVKVPVLVTFEKGDDSKSIKQIIDLTIERLPPHERTDGLGIAQWRARNVY